MTETETETEAETETVTETVTETECLVRQPPAPSRQARKDVNNPGGP